MLKDLLKGFAMLSFIFLCSCFLIDAVAVMTEEVVMMAAMKVWNIR